MTVKFENFYILLRIEVNPDKIEVTKVEDSPHFKFVNSEEEGYIKYFNEMIIPTECKNRNPDTHPHHPKSFKKLIDEFNIEKYGSIVVTTHENNFYIQDGAHRCAILKHLNVKEVEIKILE